jgi:hypothetical protein
MPGGKPAGVACVQLTADRCCRLYGDPRRPAFCSGLKPSPEMCGDTPEAALAWIAGLEALTLPG